MHLAGGIDPGPKPLGRRLFVTRGSVDLTGQEQPFNPLCFQSRFVLEGIDVIVFDGIGRTHDFGLFQPLNRPHHLHLDFHGETVSQAAGIDFFRFQAFGFQNNLVSLPFRKLDDFIFKRGTVTGRNTFDDAAIQCRPFNVVTHDFMRRRVGVADMAGDLRQAYLLAKV